MINTIEFKEVPSLVTESEKSKSMRFKPASFNNISTKYFDGLKVIEENKVQVQNNESTKEEYNNIENVSKEDNLNIIYPEKRYDSIDFRPIKLKGSMYDNFSKNAFALYNNSNEYVAQEIEKPEEINNIEPINNVDLEEVKNMVNEGFAKEESTKEEEKVNQEQIEREIREAIEKSKQEEEQRRQEERARLEQERAQKEEEERLRKELEEKLEAQRQEELRKEEEQRKQEEEQKKREEEQRQEEEKIRREIKEAIAKAKEEEKNKKEQEELEKIKQEVINSLNEVKKENNNNNFNDMFDFEDVQGTEKQETINMLSSAKQELENIRKKREALLSKNLENTKYREELVEKQELQKSINQKAIEAILSSRQNITRMNEHIQENDNVLEEYGKISEEYNEILSAKVR